MHLNSGESKYVIEGVVSDQPGASAVSITQTKDFSSDNTFAGVSGATVTVENGVTIFPLAESTPGVYTNNNLTGVPGETYVLKVVINGVDYSASSTMPQPVGLDTMYVSNDDLTSRRYISIAYSDPPGIPNYYRWVQYVNGRKEKTVFVANDEFADGLKVHGPLNFNNDTNDPARDIKTGDSVRIDMLNLDSAVYGYWYSLQRNASGSGNTASPANPTSNISGGSLGYFSAQSVRSRSLLVGR
ncbi:MAG: DUF4249 domain-containing protein [Bacteroidota bacterium]|nr:DUF4249 domain-containing protein [Bacteroidota bacterium]MDP4218176.1 DUF4249 domain-containing protein [Bacteroidota bacterium]MDP4246597.1 DUF4249 domain-containing protein [Bacteroidota bacterium]MDP4253257.1 DUF4249 domain-containing protein [Bacteroidota bacterium]MDP4259900.1 DUF4249 domain-containing protein [Bacteroidota bacterium]